MGSVPFKSQQDNLINQHRKIIFKKWKYQIQNRESIQCNITFDNSTECILTDPMHVVLNDNYKYSLAHVNNLHN